MQADFITICEGSDGSTAKLRNFLRVSDVVWTETSYGIYELTLREIEDGTPVPRHKRVVPMGPFGLMSLPSFWKISLMWKQAMLVGENM